MMRVKDDPATRLRVLMSERDINTQELADIVGVTPTAISNMRTGKLKRSPNTQTAKRIAKALGVKTSDIWHDR